MTEQLPQNTETTFPNDKYEKKVFTFTREELAKVRSYETIKTMGTIADSVITIMLNECLKKVGVMQQGGLGLFYDVTDGTYTTYIPRQKDETAIQNATEFLDKGKEADTNAS